MNRSTSMSQGRWKLSGQRLGFTLRLTWTNRPATCQMTTPRMVVKEKRGGGGGRHSSSLKQKSVFGWQGSFDELNEPSHYEAMPAFTSSRLFPSPEKCYLFWWCKNVLSSTYVSISLNLLLNCNDDKTNSFVFCSAAFSAPPQN